MKNKIILLSVIGICILGLLVFSFLKITECDSLSGDCDIAGNEGQKEFSETTVISLPEGYTLDSYTIEKVTESSCDTDADCETPMEYLVQSRCPFTSLCLENKCAVICPDVKTVEFQGNITEVKPEMDDSIIVENAFTGEHPCNLEPDPGNCEAAMPRYYFDKEERTCKEFLWGGCDGTVPFDLLEVCKSTCERIIR